MSEKSRVQIAAEAVQNWLQEEIQDAQDIQVSYAPRNALSDFPADKYALFLTPEDVSIFDKVHDKTKFTEVVTLTLSIVRKIETIVDLYDHRLKQIIEKQSQQDQQDQQDQPPGSLYYGQVDIVYDVDLFLHDWTQCYTFLQ